MVMWIIAVVIIVAPMLSKVSCHEGKLRSGDVTWCICNVGWACSFPGRFRKGRDFRYPSNRGHVGPGSGL